jgi:hypothetical protein
LKNILALGNAASNIVDNLSAHSVYKIYKINNSDTKDKNTYTIPELDSVEDYENLRLISKIPFLSKIKDEVTFFVCGASTSSGLSLRLLESLHKKGVKIKVIYFHPEVDFLSNEQTMQERVVRSVLQEYARSGLRDRDYFKILQWFATRLLSLSSAK